MYIVVIALIGVFPQHSCSPTRAGPLPKPGWRPILTRGSKRDPKRLGAPTRFRVSRVSAIGNQSSLHCLYFNHVYCTAWHQSTLHVRQRKRLLRLARPSGTVAGHHGCGSWRSPGLLGGGWSAGLTVLLVS